jgi:hypothetical protein
MDNVPEYIWENGHNVDRLVPTVDAIPPCSACGRHRWSTGGDRQRSAAVKIDNKMKKYAGTYEYYPYAYVEMPEPYCDGFSEDSCALVYDEVETLEGDLIPQCVAYCPRQ